MSTDCRELILLTRAERMLAEARTIDQVRDIRDKAQAVKVYAKKVGLSRAIILYASELKVRAKRKLGEILKAIELADSAPGNQYTGKLDRSHDATGPLRLRDLGITKSDSSRAQQIASLHEAVFAEYVEGCLDSHQEPTTAGLLRLAKQQKANDSVVGPAGACAGLVSDLHELIDANRRFATIYADPPWRYDNQGTRAATNNHYPTMTVEEIAAQPVPNLAADNCHLHLWTTNAFLPAAFQVIQAWGFEYKSCLVWVKPQLGIGDYWRVSHEFLLLGVRGKLPFRDRSQRSWIEADRTGHSTKPAIVRSLIEQVSPGPYLEMYGRESPPNPAWTVYGNQVRPTANE